MFTRQVGWSGAPAESHYPTDVGNTIVPRSTRLSELSTGYLEMFDGGGWWLGGFVHRPWLYIAIAAIAAVRFGRRWPLLFWIPPLQIAILAGLFFLSPISKTRLVYAIYLIGVVAASYLLFGARRILQDQLRIEREDRSRL